MKIVTIKEVAAEVYAFGQYLARNFSEEDLREPGSHPDDAVCGDCRLQVHDGSWYFHTGSADYDQDHRGSWGAAFVPRGVTKSEARGIAKSLIDEAMSDYDMSESDEEAN